LKPQAIRDYRPRRPSRRGRKDVRAGAGLRVAEGALHDPTSSARSSAARTACTAVTSGIEAAGLVQATHTALISPRPSASKSSTAVARLRRNVIDALQHPTSAMSSVRHVRSRGRGDPRALERPSEPRLRSGLGLPRRQADGELRISRMGSRVAASGG
jgi:hypothetical protein